MKTFLIFVLFLGLMFTSVFFISGYLKITEAGSITVSALVPHKSATTTFSYSAGGSFTFSVTSTSAGDVKIEFTMPTNFYTENLQMQSFAYDKTVFESQKPPPADKSFIGKVYDFNFLNASNTSVTHLSSAPTIVLYYLDADVSGYNESTIAPYRRGESDTAWRLISGYSLNTSLNAITFATSTFSSFGIIGAPSCSDGSDNDGDSKTDYPADPGCSSATDNDETDPTSSPPPSSSGGGGGGGYSAPATSVILGGRAYPKSAVTVLKDAQVTATTVAGADGNFQFIISGISTGNYIFSVYSEDNKGNRSSLSTFPVSATSGSTAQIGGIFIAPTIVTDKSEVKRGDTLAIFGQSAPQARSIRKKNFSAAPFRTKTEFIYITLTLQLLIMVCIRRGQKLPSATN